MIPKINPVDVALQRKITDMGVTTPFLALLRSVELRAEVLNREFIESLTADSDRIAANGKASITQDQDNKLRRAALMISAIKVLREELEGGQYIQSIS